MNYTRRALQMHYIGRCNKKVRKLRRSGKKYFICDIENYQRKHTYFIHYKKKS